MERELPFGGLNMLLMGDLMQIEPVHGSWIYEQPADLANEVHLWRLFQVQQLVQNVRQNGDKAYGDLCDRVRVGQQTGDDLYTLSSRLLENVKNPEFFDDAVRLISKNKEVHKHNDNMFNRLKTKKYRITPEDTYANNSDFGKKALATDLYSKIEKCGGMLNELRLAVGARVMLRKNLNVSYGLVSGSRIVAGCMKIEPASVRFQAKRGKTISRYMLPLILCWAVTIHKMQGATLEKAVVDLDCFGNALEYVALSRVKTILGLAITRINYARFIRNTIVCKKSLKELALPFNDSVSLGQSCSQKRKKQSSIKINHKKPKKN